MRARQVRSARDAAIAVKGRRKELGLSQAELARRTRVSRKWISEFEAGKPSAEFELVLRVFDELGIRLTLTQPVETENNKRGDSVDLDSVLRANT